MPGTDNITLVPAILPEKFCMSDMGLTISQVCELLSITPGTWRGWVSKKQAPTKDGDLDGRTPIWRLGTIIEYVRMSPGGRLGYPVG